MKKPKKRIKYPDIIGGTLYFMKGFLKLCKKGMKDDLKLKK